MSFAVRQTALEGVLVVKPEIHGDDRGFFLETYQRDRYREHGIADDFVQDNHSRSARGVLRGIHYQDMTAPMSKLIRCTLGRILDVAVDLRLGSPTFGKSVVEELTAENMHQLYVPVGFGHAFLTLSDYADVEYKCGGYYAPKSEGSVLWNDSEIGITWPDPSPTLSDRDRRAPSLADYRRQPAFTFPVRV